MIGQLETKQVMASEPTVSPSRDGFWHGWPKRKPRLEKTDSSHALSGVKVQSQDFLF